MMYVDNAGIMYKGKLRYHLATTLSIKELHAFAERVNIKRCWYHNRRFPHYDITEPQRLAAIEAGAIPVTSKQLVKILKETNADT